MSRVLALALLVVFVAIDGTQQQAAQQPQAVKQQPRMMMPQGPPQQQQLGDPSRPCSSNPCQNGAKCTDQVKDNFFGYSCACVAPWGGVNCDQNKNDLTERSQRASMMMGPMGPMNGQQNYPMGGPPNYQQQNMNMQQPQGNMMQQQQLGGMMRPQQQGQQGQQPQHPDQRQVPQQQGQAPMGMPQQGNFMPQGQNMPPMQNGQMGPGKNIAPNDQAASSLQNRQLDNTNKAGNAQNPAGPNGDNRNKKDWDNYNGIWPGQNDMNNWVGSNDRWNNYGGGYNGYNSQYNNYNNYPGNYPGSYGYNNGNYGGGAGYNNFNNYNSNPLYQNSWQNGYNNAYSNVGCMSSPCMNNGYCVPNGSYGYSCNCAFSYYGHRCQFRNTGAVLGVVLGTILPVTFIAIVAVGVFIYIRRRRVAK